MIVRRASILLVFFLLLPLSARSQTPFFGALQGESKPSETAPQVPISEDIANKKAQNLRALEELKKSELLPESDSPLGSVQELREELDASYEQILESLSTQADLEKAKKTLEESREKWRTRKEGDGKASFFQLDDLTTERMLQKGRVENLAKGIQTNLTMLEEAKSSFEEKERERRQAKERLELTKDPALSDAMRETLELAEIQSQIAEAKILFLQTDLKTLKQEKDYAELQVGFSDEKIRWLSQNVKFTQSDLQEKLRVLAAEEAGVNQAIASLRSQLTALHKATPTAETSPSTPSPEDVSGNLFLGAVKGLEKKHLQTQIRVLTLRLGRLKELELLWRRRFQSFNEKVAVTTMAEWVEQNQQALDQIRRTELSIYGNNSEMRKQLIKVQEQISVLSPGEERNKNLLYAQKDLLEKTLGVNQEALSGLVRDRQLFEKFQNEIKPKVESRGIKERVAEVWEKILWVWNFELTSIDDKPITVKKLALVLILLLLGVKFSRRSSQLLGNKIFPRLGMESGVSAGLTTLTFYALLLLVSIIILYIVNVPLTMFTVLGGALAIGVGFGSQNIVKNFISGLILLMERPIKVGDLVQLDDAMGTIERIGARSTVLRSFTNVQVIVPNSDFLEKKLTNWTLSDDLARTNVVVGVAYGSPTREVAKLMTKAVVEHGQVLSTPEPVVLFSDFGDNSLKFEIHFWIRMRTMLDRKRVESEVRFRIDSLFQEAGIVIAFPQRDIHIVTTKPVPVQMVERDSAPPSRG